MCVSASVNFVTGKAQITFLPGVTDAGFLTRLLTQTGYPAHIQNTDQAEPDRAERHQRETQNIRRLTLIAAALALPVFATEMGGHLSPPFRMWLHAVIGQDALWSMQFVLTTLILFWPGRVFFTQGIPALLRGAPEMNSLVVLGTGAAWAFSTVSLFAPSLLPDGARATYFESAAVIITLILMGRWQEARAKGRTGAAISKLLTLQPDVARVERGGEIHEVPIEEIGVGDTLHIRPGARIPLDAQVISGTSYLDESMITGEPLPVTKETGDEVTGGTVNGEGALICAVTRVGRDTVLAQIITLVEQAQGAKLPVQALADRVVRIFVPSVLLIAVISMAAWLIFGPEPQLQYALLAAVSVLIIACPCAMGLATPTSIMVGTGRAAELGVLFRKGEALQQLEQTRVVAFDKTGTLTEGKPQLTTLIPFEPFHREEVLSLSAALERQSEHPIARAIEAAAKEEGLTPPTVQNVTAITGYGLRAQADGRRILIGAARLMEKEGVNITPAEAALADMALQGQTPVLIAVNNVLAGVIGVSDRVKPSARQSVQDLKTLGLNVAMITGDTPATAQAIATDLGIAHVEAGVLPGGKAETVNRLRQQFGAVAFVGDGINDAPALAEADTGLAVGTGTDIAIEAADVVLSSGDLAGVVNALNMSRLTLRNIRQNLFWAFAYNVAPHPRCCRGVVSTHRPPAVAHAGRRRHGGKFGLCGRQCSQTAQGRRPTQIAALLSSGSNPLNQVSH